MKNCADGGEFYAKKLDTFLRFYRMFDTRW